MIGLPSLLIDRFALGPAGGSHPLIGVGCKHRGARFKPRVEALDAELAEIQASLTRAEARKAARNTPDVNIAAVYARAVETMETLLGDPDLVEQAHGYLRVLIHRIVLVPDPAAERSIAVTLETDFGALLSEAGGTAALAGEADRIARIPC